MSREEICRRTALAAGGAAAAFIAAPTAHAASAETRQLKDRLPQWTKVGAERAHGWPYSSIGSISLWHGAAFQRPFGTAWICGAGRVATAAHVLRDVRSYLLGEYPAEEAKGFELRVCLGYTRAGSSAQNVRIESVDALISNPQHRSEMDAFDYGYIVCGVQGRSLLAPSPTLDPQINSVEVCGYPSGVWSVFHDYPGDELVTDASKAEREGAYLTYRADTFGGHSGAPVLKRSPSGDVYSVAVHVGPHCDRNKGVWINETVADFLRG